MAPDFWAFSKAGRKLSNLHLNYETCQEYPLTIDQSGQLPPSPQPKGASGMPADESPPSLQRKGARGMPDHYKLTTRKMRYTDKQTKNAIRINDHITIRGIPPDAHRYIVNGRTPLEWIIDRYHIKTDKPSGIIHDPNKWFEETGDNIVSMIKRITHTSIQTAHIIDTLPTPFTDNWTPPSP